MGSVNVFACWLTAGTFLVAAVAKLRDLPSFVASVAALGRFPTRRARTVALGVVAAESATAALCAVPLRTGALAGLVLGVALLTAFGVVAVTSGRRRQVPCRCFGAGTAPLGIRHAVRNAVLVGVAVAGATAAGASPPPPAGWALAGAAAAAAVALVARADDLVDLFRPVAHPVGR